MKRTIICEMLGIKYPILQGGMGFIASAELAVAVSNAGGLGIISPTGACDVDETTPGNLRRQIKKAKSLTDKPVGVNISLELIEHAREEIDVALEEKISVFTVGAGSPAVLTKYIKQRGARVLHVIGSVKHARKAESEGVDGVIASGVEAGGLLGPYELTTMTLIPQVMEAVKIPVIAAGGIGNGRCLAAALMLGAAGVQIGTLFVATHECPAHTKFKELIVEAEDADTVVTGRRSGAARVLKNKLAKEILEMEASGAPSEEIAAFIGRGRGRMGVLDGDLETGSLWAGQVVGMIKEIRSVAEVMQSLVDDCDAALDNFK